MQTDWYKTFFQGVANDLWRKAITPEQTRAEADFIEATLGHRSRLLDVPCGNGRLALELAARGCRLTGLDLSGEFIAEARAASQRAGLRIQWVHADMVTLAGPARFQGAYCFGNSFGYMPLAGTRRFLRGLARALKPGAGFVLDCGVIAETLIPSFREREWFQVQDIHFAIENRYLADVSCLETECTFIKDGKTEKHSFWHWVYTAGEVRRMLEEAGFKVLHLYSSLDRQPFKLGAQRLLLVAQRSGRRPTPN
jgi:SAM-dependent methyltransferase